MAEQVPAGRVRINVFDVDDTVGIFRGGRGFTQVYGDMGDAFACTVARGEVVRLRFESSYNIVGQWKATITASTLDGRELARANTAGQWKATIIVSTLDGREIYRANPNGSTGPLGNAVWSDELTLIGH